MLSPIQLTGNSPSLHLCPPLPPPPAGPSDGGRQLYFTQGLCRFGASVGGSEPGWWAGLAPSSRRGVQALPLPSHLFPKPLPQPCRLRGCHALPSASSRVSKVASALLACCDKHTATKVFITQLRAGSALRYPNEVECVPAHSYESRQVSIGISDS